MNELIREARNGIERAKVASDPSIFTSVAIAQALVSIAESLDELRRFAAMECDREEAKMIMGEADRGKGY